MRLLLSLVVLALTILPGIARADIAPPPGFVEKCVEDLVRKPGETCQTCDGSFSGSPCEARYAGTQLSWRCKTHGASVWTEIWCGPTADAGGAIVASGAASPGRKESCASAGPSMLALAAVAFLSRRRALR